MLAGAAQNDDSKLRQYNNVKHSAMLAGAAQNDEACHSEVKIGAIILIRI
jgi:hypothetical protein